MPVVTVALPFRDGERYLAQALESVLSQDFGDYELLAVDDGSRDGSAAVVAAAARRDPRVRLVPTRERGLPGALNTAIAVARGRYIARMDADDVSLPGRFSAQVQALERDPSLLVIGGAVDLIDQHGRVLQTSWLPTSSDTTKSILAGGRCCICHPATMIRRATLDAVGGYRTFVPLTEDFDLWLRLAHRGDLRNLERRVLQYRLHRGSVAFHRTREQVLSLLKSAVLAGPRLSPADRHRAETSTDPRWLMRWLYPDRDPEAVFITLVEWYVENAALTGEHRAARRLAALLAAMAPEACSRSVERRLRLTAALVAASQNSRAAACRHLLGIAGTSRPSRVLWRSVIRPPVVDTRAEPPGAADRNAGGGYLDLIQMHEGRRYVLLYGWMAVLNGSLPREVAVVAPGASRLESFRLVRRDDVAEAIGRDHLYAGFQIAIHLDRLLDWPHERVRIWTRHPAQEWTPLHDAMVRADDSSMPDRRLGGG